MKDMMKTALMFVLVFGFICMPVVSAETRAAKQPVSVKIGDQDFMLMNSTGVEIYALYVTPHSSKTWGDDILGIDTLPAGEDVMINFSPKTKSTYWDLRIEDEDGNYIEWDRLNLKKIATLELFYNNGKATAIIN